MASLLRAAPQTFIRRPAGKIAIPALTIRCFIALRSPAPWLRAGSPSTLTYPISPLLASALSTSSSICRTFATNNENVDHEAAATTPNKTPPGCCLLPEFNLSERVILVSGAAQGLGLTQAEALLEAGATVYALDRQPAPSPDFSRVADRADKELGTKFHYRQVDVRDNPGLNRVVAEIGDAEGRMDGLVAAAGIQQETPALEYSAEDANRMFAVNVTGVFMTSQAVAKQMIRFGSRGGSICLIASMSGTVANRVCMYICMAWDTLSGFFFFSPLSTHLPPPNKLEWSKANYRKPSSKSRISSAPPTTPPKPPSSSSPATSPRSGACTASGSTRSRPATS